MKVVELLKLPGAWSFLDYGAAYVPHLGDKTCYFLAMITTNMLLKMCKDLALYPQTSQQNINYFWKTIPHRPVQSPRCTHHNLLLPNVMNPKVPTAPSAWLNPVSSHTLSYSEPFLLASIHPKSCNSSTGDGFVYRPFPSFPSIMADSVSHLNCIFHNPLDPVDAGSPSSCPKTPQVHQIAQKQVEAETTQVIFIPFKVHLCF